MEQADGWSYWCHMCSQMVNPILEVEVEMIKCPLCQSGFVEEMNSTTTTTTPSTRDHLDFGGSDSDRALSLWAPILLGMMGNRPTHRRRFRRLVVEEEDEDDNNDHDDEEDHHRHEEGETTELDRELESIIRSRMRRRRSSATIRQLLQGIRAGMLPELENNAGAAETETDSLDNNRVNRDRGGDRERGVILINAFNQTIVVQGSYDSSQSQNENQNQNHPIGSLGDYFSGPGLELLLQHLAENDPNRHGTPPAQKEAVEALPTVRIKEEENNIMQCSVCLDDFEIGSEAKEMPCKHKFHGGCILPWLELHSSCPVCRHQLPTASADDESKLLDSNNNNNNSNGYGDDVSTSSSEEGDGGGRRFSVPLPWPFSNLFSSSGSGNSSASSTNAPGSSSRTYEN